MMIREQGSLPFIIVAPLLSQSYKFSSFPEVYMSGFFDEVLATYRVDRKRVYVTGLSLGSEASYRFALHRPKDIAAVATLSGFSVDNMPGYMKHGLQGFAKPLERLKDIPIWAINGADDIHVTPDVAEKTAEDFRKAGVDVTLTILEDHDHDVWTNTYSDAAFYEWFLKHTKP